VQAKATTRAIDSSVKGAALLGVIDAQAAAQADSLAAAKWPALAWPALAWPALYPTASPTQCRPYPNRSAWLR
jgi:hypothetical protein